jgi:hypothetical protein
MMNFIDLMAVIGMFLLRVGVPAAITVGVVFLLKRLDRRWEIEARAERKAGKVAGQPAGVPVAPSKPLPSPELPFIPPPAVPDRRIQPGVSASQAVQPGLSTKSTRAEKALCDAPQNANKPCWQVRFDAEGQIPEECVGCDIFQRYPVM